MLAYETAVIALEDMPIVVLSVSRQKILHTLCLNSEPRKTITLTSSSFLLLQSDVQAMTKLTAKLANLSGADKVKCRMLALQMNSSY